MTRPSNNPTIADLYLAFRQAKTALYFEKRGVGLLKIAEDEQELPISLKALKSRFASGKWFDQIEIGETWIVTKRLRETDDIGDDVVRIGFPKKATADRHLDIQLLLSPHPDFAIVEVLYLLRFGGNLDAMFSRKEVLVYRLELRERKVIPHRRWLFEYWPRQYQAFRSAPLEIAKTALNEGK